MRKFIGLHLVGDSVNQAWRVMDVLTATDFPDIRYKAAVQSPHGNLLVIPCEADYQFRVYVEMEKLGEDERVSARGITLDKLIAAAQRILHPFSLEVKEMPRWSVYEIGQHIVPNTMMCLRRPRVFIAGMAATSTVPKRAKA